MVPEVLRLCGPRTQIVTCRFFH